MFAIKQLWVRAQIGAEVTDLKRNGKVFGYIMRVKSSDNVDGIIMQNEKDS